MQNSKRHTPSCPNLLRTRRALCRPWPTLSITYDTLPASKPFFLVEHPGGLLITVSDRLSAAEVDEAYRRHLDPRILELVVTAFGVGHPADPDHWHRWWDPDAVADWGIIHALEISGRITPWPHGQ